METRHLDDRSLAALIALRRILRSADMNARQISRQAGMTVSQLLVLNTIGDRGEIMAKDLARHLGVTQATATNLLQKLEGRGLLTRRKGEADRRQVWITLTAEGQRLLEDAPDALQDIFLEQFGTLEGWEQSMVIAVLERVGNMLGAKAGDAAPVLTLEELDQLHEAGSRMEPMS